MVEVIDRRLFEIRQGIAEGRVTRFGGGRGARFRRKGKSSSAPKPPKVEAPKPALEIIDPPSKAPQSFITRQATIDPFTGLRRISGESKSSFEFRQQELIRGAEVSTQQSLQRPNISLLSGGVGFASPRRNEVIPNQAPQQETPKGFFDRLDSIEKQVVGFGTQTSAPSLIGFGSLGFRPQEMVLLQENFARGVLPSTKGEFISTGLSLGGGALIGGTSRGINAIIAGVGSRSPQAGLVAKQFSRGFNTNVALGLTAGFGANLIKDISINPTPSNIAFELGTTSRDILGFGVGGKAGTKGADILIGRIRTAGLPKLPESEIIAPEIFQGQAFPQGKPGQTAGQLRKEFFEAVPSLRETTGTPRGFRASDIATGEILAGGRPRANELTGTFISPRLNPRFFRLSGSSQSAIKTPKDLLASFEFGLPRATRFNLPSLEFVPRVSAKTPLGTPLRFDPKVFSESVKGSGRTFIQAQKTEKEALIALDSLATRPQKVGFISQQGIRIPVFESSVIRGRSGGVRLGNIGKDVFPRSSSAVPSLSSVLGVSSSPLSRSKTSKGRSKTSPSRSGFLLSGLSGVPTLSNPSRSGLSSSISSILGIPRRSQISPTASPRRKKPRVRIKLPLLGAPLKKGKVRGKRKLRRTPSLIALRSQLNIRVQKPRRSETTGLTVRGLLG